MKTRLLLQIGVFLAVGGLLPHAGYAQSQRDMVCQGSCGGGCGPCPTSGGTTAAPATPTLDPALANAAQSIGYSLGQQLGKALFGDPAAKAAAAAAAQQQALANQRGALAAQQLYNSGIYLLKAGNVTGAINEFQQALAITPNDATILHSLAAAKQRLKDDAVAAKNSGALANVLGGAPASAGIPNFDSPAQSSAANPNASALNSVNLDSNVVDFRGLPGNTAAPATVPNSDPNVVNLSGTTGTSPASLKSQIDAVFGNPTPVSAPPAAQVTPADVDAIFAKPMPDPNATMKKIFDLNDKSK